MKQTYKATLTIGFFVLLLFSITATTGQIPSGGKDLARDLFDSIKESRDKVENFKCNVIYLDYHSKEVKQILLENLKNTIPRKVLEKQLDKLNDLLNDGEDYKFQKHKLAFDKEYRARIEMILGKSDSKGSLSEVQSKRIATWDGKNSIQYSEKDGNAGAILNVKQPPETEKGHRQPWHTFGGTFYDHFSKAISDGSQIDVQREKDGTYRVELFYAKDRKRVGIIDPAQGFSLILHESYDDGRLVARYKAKFTEASPDIWFPVEGEFASFSTDTGSILTKNSSKVSDIVINDPNFYDGLFHVDFPKGTSVQDSRTGIQYTVGEPMSRKLSGVSGAQSIDEIAKDTLEEIAKEAEQKHEEIEIFIPKVSIALKKRTLFILDLSNRKLIHAPGKPDSEKTHKYLIKIGEGDIAWDGNIVATRGASVLTIRQESNRPLTFTKGKWSRAYKLPEKVELPYSMLIVTKEETNYLMTVRKIESGGIRVNYRQLYYEELSRYKQESKDK